MAKEPKATREGLRYPPQTPPNAFVDDIPVRIFFIVYFDVVRKIKTENFFDDLFWIPLPYKIWLIFHFHIFEFQFILVYENLCTSKWW